MKSEHTVTVIVLDENDSPSTPRSVHIIVHSFNGKTPMGKIADVHPNDPDTTGDYTCKILQGSNPAGVLTVPIACDLHTSKITPGTCSKVHKLVPGFQFARTTLWVRRGHAIH